MTRKLPTIKHTPKELEELKVELLRRREAGEIDDSIFVKELDKLNAEIMMIHIKMKGGQKPKTKGLRNRLKQLKADVKMGEGRNLPDAPAELTNEFFE